MGANITSITEVCSNGRFEAAHHARIVAAAECLASPSPRWLVEVLSNFSFDVATQHHVDTMSPTRVAQFQTLTSAQQNTLQLLDFLQKPFAFDFLAARSPDAEGLREQLQPLLSLFVASIRTAYTSLTDEQGKVLPGRGKAQLPGQVKTRSVCAAVITETDAFLGELGFQRVPAVRLYDAATNLWTSLLPLKGWGDKRRDSWKASFKAADDVRLINLRTEVRRWLGICRTNSIRRETIPS